MDPPHFLRWAPDTPVRLFTCQESVIGWHLQFCPFSKKEIQKAKLTSGISWNTGIVFVLAVQHGKYVELQD